MEPWIYILSAALARCFVKKASSPTRAAAHAQSVFQREGKRHGAISVYHFCLASISRRLFVNRKRVPGESAWHFPSYSPATGRGSAAICRWLFPIFPQRVHAQTQEGWLNRTHTQTCANKPRRRGHAPWGHFSLLLWPGPESWALTPLTSTVGHHYRQKVCVWMCVLRVWKQRLLQHMCLDVSAITHSFVPESSADSLFLLRVITITVNVTSSMTARLPTPHHPRISHTHTHTHTQGLLFCRSKPSPRSVDSLAGGVNSRNCREY